MLTQKLLEQLKFCDRTDIQNSNHFSQPILVDERWLLLKKIIEEKENRVLLFMHIPKTGGTTFGETLAEDGVAHVVSVDAEHTMFLNQVYSFIHDTSLKPIVIRAHHSLSTILKSGISISSNGQVTFISAYRNPVDVHISNVNMIIQRLNHYYMPEITTPTDIIEFCENWINRLNIKDRESIPSGYDIISSLDYANHMGNIYSTFLNHHSWQELVNCNKLKFIHYTSFDEVFMSVFNYSKPPKRKNVMETNHLQRSNLSSLLKATYRSPTILQCNKTGFLWLIAYR